MIDQTYRFIVPGQPRGYTTTNRNSRPSDQYMRFMHYSENVRKAAMIAGVPMPLVATEEHPILIKVIAYYRSGNHCDVENTRKGVCDALFYDPTKPKGKRKGNDKWAAGAFPLPRYDKENPHTVIIVKPYRPVVVPELSNDLLNLLRACTAHVYRQQFAGSHEQDREDAKALWANLNYAGVVPTQETRS